AVSPAPPSGSIALCFSSIHVPSAVSSVHIWRRLFASVVGRRRSSAARLGSSASGVQSWAISLSPRSRSAFQEGVLCYITCFTCLGPSSSARGALLQCLGEHSTCSARSHTHTASPAPPFQAALSASCLAFSAY